MKNILYVPDVIKRHLAHKDAFKALMNMPGKTFREVRGRKTIQVQLGDNSYFVKQHFGVGWGEVLKNLLALKKPILSAITEVKAIEKLEALNIASTPLVAYGQQGCNPANLQSFVMTKDLGDITSLEDLCADWKLHPPRAAFKRQLIIAVAKIAKTIHENGVNHRDFYLCHFCLDNKSLPKVSLYLIDLHRVLIHQQPSSIANMKDIAALYFSAMDVGLTLRDYLRFKRYYLKQNTTFWQQVEKRAQKLYAKFNSHKFQRQLAKEHAKINIK